jgi:hypothetical protein
MEHPEYEVADIFRDFGALYRLENGLNMPLVQHKVMGSIENCRTAFLGGHKERCDECHEIRYSYNSCRNRHCPKCQFLTKEKWIEKRTEDLLPVNYFHVVFTLPDLLRPIALRNRKVMYDILFRSVNETLKKISKNPKHLGAEIGFIAVLHTWSQTLVDHPHLHVIVPAGGLSEDSMSWIFFRNNFFMPVKVMSKIFRGKFLYYLKEAFSAGELKFMGTILDLGIEGNFKKLLGRLYDKEWVVYAKEAFQGAEGVIKYLGRYTHRVAIGNYRIKNIAQGKVTFSWRDSRDNNKIKLMTLDAREFIRRFLLHVLPERYMRIRYYGILANKNRKGMIQRCRVLLNCAAEAKEPAEESWQDMLYRLTGFEVGRCPFCRMGRMRVVALIPKWNERNRAP